MTNFKFFQTIILVIVFNLAALGAWRLIESRVFKNHEIIAGLKQEIAEAESKQKDIRELDRILQSVSEGLEKINNIFVSEADIVRFIEKLEKVAELAGVKLSIESAALPAGAEIKEPFFTINFEGDFGQNFRYLALLEKMNFQIKIDEIRLAKNEKSGDWKGQIGFKLLNYKL